MIALQRWWWKWWMMICGLTLVAGFIGSILATFYTMNVRYLIATGLCAILLWRSGE